MKRVTVGSRRRKKTAAGTARELIKEIPNLLKLIFRLLKDPKVPRLDKVLVGAVGIYVLTPIDLIPDFFGVLGWVDDLYLVGLALGRLIASAGPDLLLKHWDGSPRTLGYLVEGVEELGGMLPADVREGLRDITDDPSKLKTRRRGVRPMRRIRLDEEERVHIEE